MTVTANELTTIAGSLATCHAQFQLKPADNTQPSEWFLAPMDRRSKLKRGGT